RGHPLDRVRRVQRRRPPRHLASPARDDLFRAALEATLQGRLDDAEASCRRLLRLDPDDVEATLHLASLERLRGHAPAARRYLARTRYLDDDGRWDFQVGRELAALDQADAPPAP
ncbi:MAG: tetratricopeptide repeat protein, partial [Planctomycetes bacterium]|nr:tetratricopeptide repeat protein [Planctomycetota bacterium]